MNKFLIKGVVFCPCGGQIISNTGKVMGRVNSLLCWVCYKGYDVDECYNQREENKHVTFRGEPNWYPEPQAGSSIVES